MGSALARYGPHFIDVGGDLSSGRAQLVYRLTPSGSLFDYGVAGTLPTGLQDATASIDNGWLIVTGGLSDTGARQDVRVASVGAYGGLGAFSLVGSLPNKRVAHQAVVVRNRLYVIGGTAYAPETPSGASNTVWHTAINSNGTLGPWQTTTPLPERLTDHAAVAIGDDIYVVGGQGPTEVSDRTHYATVNADGSISSWQTSTDLLPGGGRRGHAAVAKDSKIVVTGGSGHPDAVEVTTTSTPSNFALLDKYRPELRYDLTETYRADSAATITDNCVMNGTNVGRQNRLNASNGKTKAASCPADKAADLTLGYLGSYAAASGDRVDEDNNYAADAQRLHASGAYANKTYGRVVNYPNGWRTLQYWFFYYYNPKDYPVLGGVHEGDWETAQVHLDENLNPVSATYSQHSGAESCEWQHIQRTISDRPIVYVAEGSHANYFSSGFHANEGAFDTSNGDGEWTTPVVEDITTVPGWMNWYGKWGGSERSPGSPSTQGLKWTNPLGWLVEEDGCTEEQTQGASAATKWNRRIVRKAAKSAPSLPRATAKVIGDRVRIRYRFKRGTLADRNRPRRLITSVDTSGSRFPPLTKRSLVRHRVGVVSQPIGLGKRPIKVRVATESASGVRSRVVRVSVR